jgi:uncharacterized protein Yka (UPF0111/DUF47 family)
MNAESPSLLTRWLGKVFPRTPDFHGLINEQCDLVVETMDSFVQFMEGGNPEHGLRVRELEHDGDDLKARNVDVLNRAFSTPMDREDIYRAIKALDDIVNYAKTTVREMELLGVDPDAYTLEMAVLLGEGAQALQRGFAKLDKNPAAADVDANAARKTERNTEKVYRRALAELFDAERHIAQPNSGSGAGSGAPAAWLESLGDEHRPVAEALARVVVIFKRREIYRHLSNSADQIEAAAGVLHDIVVKIS